jgi:hypothetical protein
LSARSWQRAQDRRDLGARAGRRGAFLRQAVLNRRPQQIGAGFAIQEFVRPRPQRGQHELGAHFIAQGDHRRAGEFALDVGNALESVLHAAAGVAVDQDAAGLEPLIEIFATLRQMVDLEQAGGVIQRRLDRADDGLVGAEKKKIGAHLWANPYCAAKASSCLLFSIISAEDGA